MVTDVLTTCAEAIYCRLWRWLLHRLLKCQSATAVLLRTPVSQMFIFNQCDLIMWSWLMVDNFWIHDLVINKINNYYYLWSTEIHIWILCALQGKLLYARSHSWLCFCYYFISKIRQSFEKQPFILINDYYCFHQTQDWNAVLFQNRMWSNSCVFQVSWILVQSWRSNY